MDVKTEDLNRYRRKTRNVEEDKWECSVCTYINPSESYKCQICFMRKGTSTRKPRLNPQVVEQQQLIAKAILKEKDDDHRKKKLDRCSDKQGISGTSFKLKNIDRSSPLLFEIFANGYSVVITEFQSKSKSSTFPDSPPASNCSSLQGPTGTPNVAPEQLSPADSTSTPDPNHRLHSFGEYDFSDSSETRVRGHLKSAGLPRFECSTQPVRPYTRINSSNVNHIDSPYGQLGISLPSENFSSDEMGKGKRIVETRKLNTNRSAARRKASSRRVHSVYQSKNVLKRLRVERSQTSPLVLRSERLALADDISSNASSRICRQHAVVDNSATASSKRRRTNSGTLLSKPRNSLQKRFRHSPAPESLSSDHGWSAIAVPRSAKERPLRITVKKLKSSLVKKPQKSMSSTAQNSDCPQNTYSSISPTELKCKIRMIRSPNQTSLHPNTVESDITVPSTEPILNVIGMATCIDDTSLDVSTPDQRETVISAPPRLSAESRNTSAMTDSSGATALEISR